MVILKRIIANVFRLNQWKSKSYCDDFARASQVSAKWVRANSVSGLSTL